MDTTTLVEDQRILALYGIYHVDEDGKPRNYTYGDEIIVKFSLGAKVEAGEIDEARDFKLRIEEQLKGVAEVFQSHSRVIISPITE